MCLRPPVTPVSLRGRGPAERHVEGPAIVALEDGSSFHIALHLGMDVSRARRRPSSPRLTADTANVSRRHASNHPRTSSVASAEATLREAYVRTHQSPAGRPRPGPAREPSQVRRMPRGPRNGCRAALVRVPARSVRRGPRQPRRLRCLALRGEGLALVIFVFANVDDTVEGAGSPRPRYRSTPGAGPPSATPPYPAS
jgi:hypothetical protein